MNKGTKYTLISFGLVLMAALVLFILVCFDEKENTFYSSGGIVYFAQYFILSAGILSLVFSVAGTWCNWMREVVKKTWIITMFVNLPLVLFSMLLTYCGLLFMELI